MVLTVMTTMFSYGDWSESVNDFVTFNKNYLIHYDNGRVF